MKKKILSAGIVVALAAVAVVGGTLAYFTDKDAEDNVFTVGNVAIDLTEDFVQKSTLVPGVNVNKDVFVTNTGSEESYVRVHLAIPSMLDSGSEDQPQFAAYNNTLHWNMTAASMADGLWNWNADADGANYPGNGGKWNMYQRTIDGVLYNVYVATYETALNTNDKTVDAITKVYLDTKVTNEQITEINKVLGSEWTIKVAAEGAQADGFDNAYDALNTAFGTPGSYEVAWA